MEDRDIVALFWQRSGDAIPAASGKYGGYCAAIAANILPDRRDVEECLNDTWLGAWNAMPEQRPSLLGAFLGRITRNLAFDLFRAGKAKKRGGGELPLVLEELAGCIPSAPSAAQAAEDAELERAVNRFLRSLAERDRDIFLRRYWYAEPLAEVAGRYRLNLNTVKSSLYRSREKLRDFLEEEGVIV